MNEELRILEMSHPARRTSRRVRPATFILAAAVLSGSLSAGCDGDSTAPGGDGAGDALRDGGASWEGNAGQRFQVVGSPGELSSYSIDRAGSAYSFEVIESALALEGVTGGGPLLENEDTTFSPAADPLSRMMILESGLLIGIDRITPQSSTQFSLLAGLPDPRVAHDPEEISGVFNILEHRCDHSVDSGCQQPAAITTTVGSIRVQPIGVIEVCSGGLVEDRDSYPCATYQKGPWEVLADGRISFDLGSAITGTCAVRPSTSGGAVLLMIKRDPRGAATSVIFGVQLLSLSSADVGGRYLTFGADGSRGELDVDDERNSYHLVRTPPGLTAIGTRGDMERDRPWDGWLHAVDGEAGTATQMLLVPGAGPIFRGSIGAGASASLEVGGGAR
jgi:hypothetical protein